MPAPAVQSQGNAARASRPERRGLGQSQPVDPPNLAPVRPLSSPNMPEMTPCLRRCVACDLPEPLGPQGCQLSTKRADVSHLLRGAVKRGQLVLFTIYHHRFSHVSCVPCPAYRAPSVGHARWCNSGVLR